MRARISPDIEARRAGAKERRATAAAASGRAARRPISITVKVPAAIASIDQPSVSSSASGETTR